jgi:hypothetical protein
MLRMIKYIPFFFLFCCCKSTQTTVGNRNEVEACDIVNTAFQSGEQLTYKLYYNLSAVWVAAGEVTFKIEDRNDQYYIRATGKTYASYDPIFKVNDCYEAYLDKKTLLPVVSIREVHEGGYNLYDKVVFDQSTHKATSHRGDNALETRETTYDVATCMHDLISIIYFSRNLDFEELPKNSYFPISIFMDKSAHPLQVRYNGAIENLEIKGLGKQNVQSISPQAIDGRVFKEGANITIAVSDDKKHIPLLIEAPLSVGSVKAVLKR